MMIAAAPKPVRAQLVVKALSMTVTAPKHVRAPCCAMEHSANQFRLNAVAEQEMAAVQNGPTPVELNWYLQKM